MRRPAKGWWTLARVSKEPSTEGCTWAYELRRLENVVTIWAMARGGAEAEVGVRKQREQGSQDVSRRIVEGGVKGRRERSNIREVIVTGAVLGRSTALSISVQRRASTPSAIQHPLPPAQTPPLPVPVRIWAR